MTASKKSVRRARVNRSFTVRGNPEVARRVSIELLSEKLPELASIVGIESSAVAAPAVSLDVVAGSGAMISSSYRDSELDESEDPDRLTAEIIRNP
ncbi:MAG: hypothetical protein H7X80_10155, partial [bacterium]|nr:hypothetical protein [Candidatus Kapabacteria bacterium]